MNKDGKYVSVLCVLLVRTEACPLHLQLDTFNNIFGHRPSSGNFLTHNYLIHDYSHRALRFVQFRAPFAKTFNCKTSLTSQVFWNIYLRHKIIRRMPFGCH